jgi:Domain of unknown function (DUF5606)
MDYNRIVAVTGLPGLYEVISSKADGAIVRSLEDGSTKFISSRVHNLSHLESIEVYTVRDNVTLADIFSSMKENKTALPDTKDNKALKGYFEAAYPDLDFDRVYASDMKKMVKWYEVLQQNNVDFTAKPEPEAENEAPVAEPVAVEESAEEKPAKAKKAAPKKAKAEAEATAVAPKKAAAKKKAK